MERGLVVILSGASSVGKHGIRDRLKADPELKLHYSVSITTRPPRRVKWTAVTITSFPSRVLPRQ